MYIYFGFGGSGLARAPHHRHTQNSRWVGTYVYMTCIHTLFLVAVALLARHTCACTHAYENMWVCVYVYAHQYVYVCIYL